MKNNNQFIWTYKTRYNEEFLEIGAKLTWRTIIKGKVMKLEGEIVEIPNSTKINPTKQ